MSNPIVSIPLSAVAALAALAAVVAKLAVFALLAMLAAFALLATLALGTVPRLLKLMSASVSESGLTFAPLTALALSWVVPTLFFGIFRAA
jgi:hypothetical protein